MVNEGPTSLSLADQKDAQHMNLHKLLNDEISFPKSGIFYFFESRMNYSQELSAEEETSLKKDLLWDLHQGLFDGTIHRLVSSPSRSAHVVVTASGCILLTIYGAYCLKVSWLFDEDELAVRGVKWMEEDHLAIVEFRHIPEDKQQRCVCYFPQNTDGFIISGNLPSCEDCTCMESKSYDSLDLDRFELLPDTLPRVIGPTPIDDDFEMFCFHEFDGNGNLLRETIGFLDPDPEGKTEDERIEEMRNLLKTSVPPEENADEKDDLQSGITIKIDL